ncbi:aminoacyl-tRNA deacylase [Vibrio breoganii]|uniref:aminoacyl-tRNA deacylase n=1 Tax=Vibrio breoganii TaxID=553239 RepID=UPI0021C25D38|nr:YbaK/EbsC family protein [Vibrio breoganii]MDN3717212.1 YbaK/EbsC family protein [Vibrio breoganii]
MLETAVTQFLQRNGVGFTMLPHSTPAISIGDAAKQRGISSHIMLKTVLLRDMGGKLFLACIPGDQQVDPKKVRAHFNCRRTTCVNAEEVVHITGFKPGTLTPLILPESITTIFDHSVLQLAEVTISSGSDMAGIMLRTEDVLKFCKPQFSHITKAINTP